MVALVVAVERTASATCSTSFGRTSVSAAIRPRSAMMLAFGWRSTNAPRVHLLALESHGLIERDRGVCRAIRVLKK